MLPTIHLKNKVEADQVSVTSRNLSNDPIQLTKHAPVGPLQLNTDYHENQNIADLEINLVSEKKGRILPCTLSDAKHVCSPTEMDTNTTINLDSTNK